MPTALGGTPPPTTPTPADAADVFEVERAMFTPPLLKSPKCDWYDDDAFVKKFAVAAGTIDGELVPLAWAAVPLLLFAPPTAKPGVVTFDEAKCDFMLGTADMVKKEKEEKEKEEEDPLNQIRKNEEWKTVDKLILEIIVQSCRFTPINVNTKKKRGKYF